jgi:uridine kinase
MNQVIEAVLANRRQVPASRSVLVGVSGIDGSGKGYVSDRLAARLRDPRLTSGP